MKEKAARADHARDRGPAPRFEDALGKLQESVARLEAGELDLSDALACYEQGIGQLKVCYELLEDAERRIELLCGVDAEGNPTTTPYADDVMSLEQKLDSRSQRRTHSATSVASDVSPAESSSPTSETADSDLPASTSRPARRRLGSGGSDSLESTEMG
jgi:exodeoxyribonuclease VII small subunit